MAELDPMIYQQQINMPYRYTAGRAQAAFLRGLADRRILGSRDGGGQTLVPARPYAPDGTPTGDLVEVAETGEVRGWTVHHHEGAVRVFGLIRLDGTDSDLLHLLDVDVEALEVGLRVQARWAAEPTTEITAIEAFEAARPSE